MDPFSLAALATDALTAAIGFLFDQAGGILKRVRARKEGKEPSPDVTAPSPEVDDIIAGKLQPLRVDFATAERLEDDIRALRRALSEYADGTYPVDAADTDVIEATDALRRALEAVYSQRLTFVGEDRPSSGPLVEGRADVDEIEGYVAGVRARVVQGGQISGSVRAKRVRAGGTAFGVDVDTVS